MSDFASFPIFEFNLVTKLRNMSCQTVSDLA